MTTIQTEMDVTAEMRDGVVLLADVYRPAGDGPWPVLLARLPYGKQSLTELTGINPTTLSSKGFIVVVQDTRGRFGSGGDWEPFATEQVDSVDTIRWAASLPGSNGAVGMFGGSYFGNNQWLAALAGAPELKAISPMITWSEPDDGLFRRGGAAELGLNLPWAMMTGIDAVIRRNAHDPAAIGPAVGGVLHELDTLASTGYWETPVERHPVIERHQVPELGFERSTRDPAWSDVVRLADKYDQIDVPSLGLGGWYDVFLQGTLDNFSAMASRGRPAHLIVGPWHHTSLASAIGDVSFGVGASKDVLGFLGSWTDVIAGWMHAQLDEESPRDSGVPPVWLFTMGTNTWRREEAWPLARAVETDLYLRSDRALSFDAPSGDEEPDAYVHDPADPVPTTGGSLLLAADFRAGPIDQSPVEGRDDVLVYTSPVLTEDLEVTGRVGAVVHVASDASTTDWVVRLCDVDPSGVSRNVVDGIRRVEVVPGEVTEVQVDLWSTSYVFRAGHQLRVQVASSNFPRWDRNFGTASGSVEDAVTARQSVVHDAQRPSRVVLPVIPAAS